MATQTLEANATSGLTIVGKLFAIGSDTVVDSVTGTEKTNDKGRYSFAFTDLAAGRYRLNGFVSSNGGFINEIYHVLGSTGTFVPLSEDTHAGTVVHGTADTGSTSTSIAIKSITPTLSATDQLKGRVILFRTDTATAALRGQGAPIDGNTTTAITLASGDALTTAPSENDTFTIV
jgi:hypothetical protein